MDFQSYYSSPVRFLMTVSIVCSAALAQPLTRADAEARAGDLVALGRRLFFDPALSASGRQSCASCHDPRFAYGPPNDLSVQFGGRDLRRQGHRAAPSLRYLQKVPQFAEHFYDSEITGEDSADNGPTGGLTWDGRVDRGRDQARIPLLSPDEMANASPAEIVKKALAAKYGSELRRLSRGGVFATILEALEAFEQDEHEFYPYSSRYDAWLAGAASLTRSELRGLELFRNPEKGNCARCHPADRGANGTPPQFTDYAFAALGVRRNGEIRANADPAWFDLGLCGPDRTDFLNRPEYCGKFRTPTLRNVALRRAFFHNGVYHTLREAVAFYVQRDSKPIEPRFSDLPPQFWPNIETDRPFGVKTPVLSDDEIDSIVDFLGSLTDADARPVHAERDRSRSPAR
jgi:cytochrome c peroxidase